MKFYVKICFAGLLFTAVFMPVFSGEKATIHYKDGSTLECIVDNYEIGKYAEVIDDEGSKRIISWHNISEIIFAKAEDTRPKNAAERWAERNNQEAQPSKVSSEEIPDVDYDRKTGKVSVEYYKTLESDSKRRSWIENGGVLKGSGFTANYTYTSMKMESIDSDFTMNGFGFTYSGTMKFIQPPNYDDGKNTWGAFSIGFMG
ncbi:MAG: hypothetical protein R6V47_04550, partial [Candidatus Delongbacteria bacterium]